MKTINKTVEITKTVYQAEDGTEFSSQEECLRYENTAKCVILSRYNTLICGKTTESDLFKGEDHRVDIVKLNNDNAVDIVLKVLKAVNGNDVSEQDVKDVHYAHSNYELLLIGWNYEEDYCWVIGTCSSLNDRITDAIIAGQKNYIE